MTNLRLTTFLIALAILVAAGLVHGFWGERWNPSPALQEAAARVEQVPLKIGIWQGKALDSDAAAFYQAGAQTYWTRSYSIPGRKGSVLVILMCGRAGRMSVHTPEVCYRGAGFEMAGPAEAVAVSTDEGDNLGTFWTARFSKPAGVASDLRLFWSWNRAGAWEASASPRMELGGQPFLYKLYVSLDAQGGAAASKEAGQDFLKQFLPELKRTLFAKGS